MSWFGGKQKLTRSKQIKSLERIRGCRSIRKDKSQWRVAVSTSQGPKNLYIDLPSGFPQTPPKLYIDSQLWHAMVDNSGVVVNLQQLRQWNAGTDIGTVVNAAINQLIANPPRPRNQQANMYSQPAHNFGQQPRASQPPRSAFGQPPQHQGKPPSYQSHMNKSQPEAKAKQEEDSDLASMSFSIPNNIWDIPRLKRLKENESEMKQIVDDDNALKDLAYECATPLRDMKHGTQQAILGVAKQNIRKKEEIDRIAKENQKVREEIEVLMQVFEQKRREQQNIQQKFAPQRVKAALDAEIEKLEQESDTIKEKFENDDITYVTFIKKLTANRTQYHLLSAKREKFIELCM